MSIWGNRDYFKDYFWLIEGGLFGDGDCLISSGIPQNATFERTGDILRDGVTFAQDEPVVQGGKYHHNGQFTNNILWSQDIENWVLQGGPTVTPDIAIDPYGVVSADLVDISTGVGDVFIRTGDVFDNTSKFQWSFWVRSVSGSGTWGINYYNGSSFSFQAINIDENWKRFCITIDEPTATQGFVYAADSRSGGSLEQAYVWGEQIVKSDYDIYPIYIPTTTTPSSIDTAASQPNPDKHGLNWEDTEEKNAWAFDLLSSGSGTMSFRLGNVIPAVDQWQTSGDFNVLSGDTSGVTSQIFYIEPVTGLVCATDGTNTSKSVQPYVAGSDSQVSIAFGESKMQIYLDSVNGTQVPFVGTFNPGETLKWGLNNEDIFSISSVCGQTTSSFSESVHLAEELAYDL